MPIALLAAGFFLVGAAPSHAAEVSTLGGFLTYAASAGEANAVTVSLSGDTYTVTDPGALITAVPPCSSSSPNSATCPAAGVDQIQVSTGDLSDSITITASTPSELDPGLGSDVVAGGLESDDINAASCTGSPCQGAEGSDSFTGGPGIDAVTYAHRVNQVTVTLDGLANDGESGEQDSVGLDIEDIVGGDGGDTLVGSSSANSLDGGSDFGGGGDVLDGAEGDDLLFGGLGGSDELIGGPGDDSLHGGLAGGRDTLSGGPGDDELRRAFGGILFPAVIDGGDDVDTVSYEEASEFTGVSVTLDGLANDGEPGVNDNVGLDVENIVGSWGNDTLAGSDVANVVDGGPGADSLSGGDGIDHLDGGDGDDSLDGGPGSDVLAGLEGDDAIDGGLGADVFNGGGGFDLADYSGRSDAVTVTLDDGAGDGAAGEGDDVRTDVEDVIGGSGGDVLVGSSASNLLAGGPGADRLSGGSEFDLLFGEDGPDILDGGPDDDLFDAGADDDRLETRDGTAESDISCGDGQDFAVADPKDFLLSDCEGFDKGPPLMVTGDATDIGETTARLHGFVTPNGHQTTVYVELGTTAEYGVRSPESSAGAGTDARHFVLALSNLSPGTTYHYRFVARSSQGTAIGADRAFTTLGVAQPPPSVAPSPAVAPPPPPSPVGPPPPPPAAGRVTPPRILRCVVPNLRGKPLAAAKALVRRRSCANGKVTRAYSRKVRKGRVISQRPRAGARLRRGAKINLLVSRGARARRR